jgi:guanine deaminase
MTAFNQESIMAQIADNGDSHKFMERALELSFQAIERGHGNPFGSVVVKDGVIVGEGWNQVALLNDPSAHAEMMAIRDAARKLSTPILTGCVIYASGQPCPMCLSLVYLAGIKAVYYCIPGDRMAAWNQKLSVDHIYKAIATPQSQRSVRETKIMDEEVEKAIARYGAINH